MVSETKLGVCKYCGSPYHRGWQCRENPKIKNQTRVKKKKTPPVSCKSSTQVNKHKACSRSALIKKYDDLFSKYVRTKAVLNKNMYCFTCGKPLTYDTAVVMHFISRRFVSIRFDEDNVHVGCRKCNTPDIDQPEVLRRYAQLLGEDTVSQLNQRKLNRISTPELEANYEELKQKYSLLLNQKRKQLI